MTSLQSAEADDQMSNSKDDPDNGGDSGSGVEENSGAGGKIGSTQNSREHEECSKSAKIINEGKTRSDRQKKSEGRRELPFDVHRRRMGRHNRYACLLASAALLIVIVVLIAGVIFVIYYAARIRCPRCPRKTWNE